MTKCIYCGKELPEDQLKPHIAQDHLGISATSNDISNTISNTIPNNKPNANITQHGTITVKTPAKETPTFPVEKPKRRYLNADEILTLLQNSHATFQLKELTPCPITKGENP